MNYTIEKGPVSNSVGGNSGTLFFLVQVTEMSASISSIAQSSGNCHSSVGKCRRDGIRCLCLFTSWLLVFNIIYVNNNKINDE